MYDIHPSKYKVRMADTSLIDVEYAKGECCCPMWACRRDRDTLGYGIRPGIGFRYIFPDSRTTKSDVFQARRGHNQSPSAF